MAAYERPPPSHEALAALRQQLAVFCWHIDSSFRTHPAILARSASITRGLRTHPQHDHSDRLRSGGADVGQLGGEVEPLRQLGVQQRDVDATSSWQLWTEATDSAAPATIRPVSAASRAARGVGTCALAVDHDHPDLGHAPTVCPPCANGGT